MTNTELTLQSAIENKNNGKLNDWEANFVSQFEGWDKKKLKTLSSKQYKTLREIANK